MEPERWLLVQDLFAGASELPASEQRAFLERRTGGDAGLLAEVSSLLAVQDHEAEAGRCPLELSIRASARAVLEETATSAGEFPAARLVSLGIRIGPYRVIEEIGEGGTSRVYLAERQDDFRHRVAIKVLKAGVHEDLLRRFRNERQILATLQHPHLVKILDAGTTPDGAPYLVMEYVAGEPIDRYCDRHRLDLRARLELFLQVCEVVQVAHEHLIVHRDLKPGNILVTAEGEPKLLDFGIAKLLQPDPEVHDADITRPELRVHSIAFASPEQVRGELVTPATDVYSLGSILYTLLTGRRPYALDTPLAYERERIVCEVVPEPPSAVVCQPPHEAAGRGSGVVASEARAAARRVSAKQLRRVLLGDLDAIVLHSLAKEPAARYRTVLEFAGDLRAHLRDEPVTVAAPRRGYRLRKALRRHRRTVLTASAILGSLLLALSGITYFYFDARESQRLERIASQKARTRLETMRALLGDVLSEFHEVIRDLPGAMEARRVFASKARVYLQALVADAGQDPRLLRELAVAYVQLGDVEGHPGNANLGEPQAALQSYHQALDLFRRRSVAEVSGADGLDVATVLDRIGELTFSTDVEAALGLHREARAERERRYGEDPSSRPYREGMARSHARFGHAYLLSGRPEEARHEFEQASTLLGDLVEQVPTAELRRSQAVAQLGLAAAQVERGDSDQGLIANRLAVAMFEELVAEDPVNVRLQRDLSIASSRVMRCLMNLGQVEEAMDWALRARAISEQVAALDPTNADAAREVCLNDLHLGYLQGQLGRGGDAVASYRAALAGNQRLRARSPQDRRLVGDRWLASFRMATFLESQGEVEVSLAHHQEACALGAELVACDDANLQLRRNFAISARHHAGALIRLQRRAQARAWLQTAETQYQELATLRPESARACEELLDFRAWRARVDPPLEGGISAEGSGAAPFEHVEQ